MKTVLFVMPRFPFPAVSGRKTSLYHYCRILNELGYRIVVAAFKEDGDNVELKPDFINRFISLPDISTKVKILNILKYSILVRRWPIQVSLYWSKKIQCIIDDLINDEKPSVVIADMIRTTEYIRNANTYRIADLDDMISLRYQRQMEYDNRSINPYGAYLMTLPKLIQNILLKDKVKNFIIRQEFKLLYNYEYNVASVFDKTIFVAQREAELMNKRIQANKAVAVPIGVDYDYFSTKVRYQIEKCKSICFLGQMNVAHNENAAIYFINNIFPLIKSHVPEATFTIIGGGVTEQLRKYENKDIIITGRVDDVRIYLQNSRVFVCPLKFGSGIKTKILEAMAAGLPVVTTIIGAENIGATNDQDWFVVNNDQDFANKVILLLCNNEIYNEIRLNGQRYVKDNWTWERAKKIFSEILP